MADVVVATTQTACVLRTVQGGDTAPERRIAHIVVRRRAAVTVVGADAMAVGVKAAVLIPTVVRTRWWAWGGVGAWCSRGAAGGHLPDSWTVI